MVGVQLPRWQLRMLRIRPPHLQADHLCCYLNHSVACAHWDRSHIPILQRHNEI